MSCKEHRVLETVTCKCQYQRREHCSKTYHFGRQFLEELADQTTRGISV